MKAGFLFILLATLLISAVPVFAHCPLCTVGAAFVAGGAAVFGVHRMVIGVFIGAFAASMGIWFGRVLQRKLVPFQRTIIFLFSYLLTVLPILPLLRDPHPFLLNLAGNYGSLLNRTYLIDYYIIGSVIGSIAVIFAPWLSEKITSLRGKHTPYQGMILTFALLVAIGILLQSLLHFNVIK